MSIELIPVSLWGLDMVEFVLQILAWSFAILVLLPLGLLVVFVPPMYVIDLFISAYSKWEESRSKVSSDLHKLEK
jgi:hypothetical protein